MKAITRITAALCCAALTLSVCSVPVQARTTTNPVRNILADGDVTVSEALSRGSSTDTLAAVTDGILYPDTPWNGSGPNPYAWTNYNATQEGIPYAGLGFSWGYPDVFTLGAPADAYKPKWVTGVTVWYFEDSWSATLPESVTFVPDWNITMEEAYGPSDTYTDMNLVSSTRLSPTCVECVYEPVNGPFMSLGLSMLFNNQQIIRSSGKAACVGVYEVEVYGYDADAPYTPDVTPAWTNNFAGILAGSTEYTRKDCNTDFARDGDPTTNWHTSWDGCAPEERYLEAYLGKTATVSGFRYYSRLGNNDGDSNGRVGDYQILVSLDGYNWTCVAEGHWDNSGGMKEVTFDPVEAVLVRLVGVTTYGNSTPNKYMSAGDIEIRARW